MSASAATSPAEDPRTHNALKDALFTRRDFIRPGEQSEYDDFRASHLACLNPKSPLEQSYADEIISAHWRLRRCRSIEAALASNAADDILLAAEDDLRQKAVDRARAHAQNALRKATAELRKLQTERECRAVYTFGQTYGLADSSDVLRAYKNWRLEKKATRDQSIEDFNAAIAHKLGGLPPDDGLDDKDETETTEATQPAPEDLICKNTPIRIAKVGRNEPCPCGSGRKYKRCCIDGPNSTPSIAA